MSDPILYRDADAGDVGFILSSWLKSAGDAWADHLRNTDVSEWCRHQGLSGTRIGWFADVPHRFTRQAVAEILERATTKALVACDPEDPTVIYGYAVAEPTKRIAHWLHVKHSMRRNGLAAGLMDRTLPTWRAGVTCTYVGRGFIGWMSRYPLKFNPHAGRK